MYSKAQHNMSSHRILLLLPFLFMNACFGQAQGDAGRKHTMHSSILHEDRAYQIHLPASYAWASDRRYPVLYLLDGETHFQHVAGSVSYLASQGEIPEVIVVAITSTVRIRDFTQSDWSSHWIGGGGAENFRRFLSTELLPEIEGTYRTNSFRILSGHSASGQFALYTLSSAPSLFQGYVAISPSLDWDDNLPRRSLQASFEHADSVRAFLYVAWADDLGDALAEDLRVRNVLESASPKGLRWVTKGFPDETHGSIALLAHIDAMRQFFAGYRLHDDLLEKGFAFAEQHYRTVSETVGYTIPVPEETINNFAYEELNKGNLPQAIEYFKRNIAQNPNSANAFDGITDAYDKAGMWTEAIASIEKAVALATRYSDPNLGYFQKHLRKVKEKSTRASEK